MNPPEDRAMQESSDSAQPSLRRNTAARRFELALGGEVAGFINYRERDGKLELVHTEVAPRHEGQGLAGQLTRFALQEAEREGRKVVPSCPYVAAWIERHPEFGKLVAH